MQHNGPRTKQGPNKDIAPNPAVVGGFKRVPNQSANDDGIIIRADATACIVIPVITANLLPASCRHIGSSTRTTVHDRLGPSGVYDDGQYVDTAGAGHPDGGGTAQRAFSPRTDHVTAAASATTTMAAGNSSR